MAYGLRWMVCCATTVGLWLALCPTVVGGAEPLTPRQLYAYAAPGTVFILSTTHVPGEGEMGTGIVIDPSGLVLTNAHVVVDTRTGRPYSTVEVMLKPAHQPLSLCDSGRC